MASHARSVSLLALHFGLLQGCSGTDAQTAPIPQPPPPSTMTSAEAAEVPRQQASVAPTSSPLDKYRRVFEALVVSEPLNAAYLLSSFDEPAGPDCRNALVRHAEFLGATHLYIDPSSPCRGSAYLVPDRSTTTSEAPPEDYAKTLHQWILGRWKPPPAIPEAEMKRLCVVTRFWTTSTLHIWKVLTQPVHSSGNAAFDESVQAALDSAIDEHVPIPEPLSVPVRRYTRNAMITVSFTTGDSRGCR